MQQRHAAPPPTVTDDDGFRSWCDAREPALHRLAVLLTADEPAARDLVRQVLPRMDATWSRIGAVAADDAARARLVDAYRRQRWQAGAAGHGRDAHDTAAPDDLRRGRLDAGGAAARPGPGRRRADPPRGARRRGGRRGCCA